MTTICRIRKNTFQTTYKTALEKSKIIIENSNKIIVENMNQTNTNEKNNEKIQSEFDYVFGPDTDNHNFISRILNDKNSPFSYFWQGFNVSILFIGASDSGKTYSLFCPDEHFFSVVPCSNLLARFIVKTLDYIQYYGPLQYSMGISIYDISCDSTRQEKITDLLVNENYNIYSNISTVQIKSPEEAFNVLSAAGDNARNIRLSPKEITRNNKSHIFIRLVLFNNKDKVMSSMYFIDPIGHSNENRDPLITQYGNMSFQSISLTILNKIKNKAKLSNKIEKYDTKYSKNVIPLLMGNCKAFVIACLNEKDSIESAISTLNFSNNVKSLCVPVVKVKAASKKLLGMIYYSNFSHNHPRLAQNHFKEAAKGKSNKYFQCFGEFNNKSKFPLNSLSFEYEDNSKIEINKQINRLSNDGLDANKIGSDSRPLNITMNDVSDNMINEDEKNKIQKTFEWINSFQKKKEKILDISKGDNSMLSINQKKPIVSENNETENETKFLKLKEVKNEIQALISKLDKPNFQSKNLKSNDENAKISEIHSPLISGSLNREFEDEGNRKHKKNDKNLEYFFDRSNNYGNYNNDISKQDEFSSSINEIKHNESKKMGISPKDASQEKLIDLLKAKLKDNESLIAEKIAAKEIEIQDYKLEISSLHSKIRKFEEGTSYNEIFEIYNNDIERMSNQIEILRNDIKMMTVQESANLQTKSEIENQKNYLSKKVTGLKNIISRLQNDIRKSEKDNDDLRKQHKSYKLIQKNYFESMKKSSEYQEYYNIGEICKC